MIMMYIELLNDSHYSLAFAHIS